MKITVLGASGRIGRRIVKESLLRGHLITAVGRNASGLRDLPTETDIRIADIANADEVSDLAIDQDVIINATRPVDGREEDVDANTRGLLKGLEDLNTRLLIVGGAASLRVPDSAGKTVLDDPRFLSPSLRHVGQASFHQYELCLDETKLDWAYLCPPADLFPGDRTGVYRLGSDELLVDEQGHSRISIEDLVFALLDEIEAPRHRQQRFTVAY